MSEPAEALGDGEEGLHVINLAPGKPEHWEKTVGTDDNGWCLYRPSCGLDSVLQDSRDRAVLEDSRSSFQQAMAQPGASVVGMDAEGFSEPERAKVSGRTQYLRQALARIERTLVTEGVAGNVLRGNHLRSATRGRHEKRVMHLHVAINLILLDRPANRIHATQRELPQLTRLLRPRIAERDRGVRVPSQA